MLNTEIQDMKHKQSYVHSYHMVASSLKVINKNNDSDAYSFVLSLTCATYIYVLSMYYELYYISCLYVTTHSLLNVSSCIYVAM